MKLLPSRASLVSARCPLHSTVPCDQNAQCPPNVQRTRVKQCEFSFWHPFVVLKIYNKLGAASTACLPLKALAVQMKSKTRLYLSHVNWGTNLGTRICSLLSTHDSAITPLAEKFIAPLPISRSVHSAAAYRKQQHSRLKMFIAPLKIDS